MKRKHILLALSLLLLASCKSEPDQRQLVANAAKQYYSYLLSGDYDSFVDGTAFGDSLRPEYRRQLLANMKMFMAEQEKAHEGINSVDVDSVALDTAAISAEVFLQLHFADSTKETVVLPMKAIDGVWYMK